MTVRVLCMGHCQNEGSFLVRISPFGIAGIFRSANNLPSKIDCVYELPLAQDIQEILSWTMRNTVTIVFL
jgi:hypothetical protein